MDKKCFAINVRKPLGAKAVPCLVCVERNLM